MRENERTRKLIEYFKKNIKKGYPEDSLKFSLISQGYPRTTVEDALKAYHLELAKKAPILEEKPIIRHEIIDEHNRPIVIEKRPAWKKFLGI